MNVRAHRERVTFGKSFGEMEWDRVKHIRRVTVRPVNGSHSKGAEKREA